MHNAPLTTAERLHGSCMRELAHTFAHPHAPVHANLCLFPPGMREHTAERGVDVLGMLAMLTGSNHTVRVERCIVLETSIQHR